MLFFGPLESQQAKCLKHPGKLWLRPSLSRSSQAPFLVLRLDHVHPSEALLSDCAMLPNCTGKAMVHFLFRFCQEMLQDRDLAGSQFLLKALLLSVAELGAAVLAAI